jgi:DNA-binding IclR family transcriptional regulator
MSSLVRGLEILSEIGTSGPSTVEQISRRLDLPISTTYRYVSMLRQLGFLTDQEGRCGAGARLLQLVRATDVDQSLARLADPLLLELVYRTGETAILTVRVGSMAFCLNSVEPVRPVRLSYARGTTQPLYAGASGKPLLAFAPEKLLDSLIEDGLVTFTPRTPDVDTLRRQLQHIRSTGLCVTAGELDTKAVAIGVPVFWDGEIAAALSVAGPISRFDNDTVHKTVALVMAAGHALTKVLDEGADPRSAVTLMDSEVADDLAARRPTPPGTAAPAQTTRTHPERRGA